MEKNYILAFTPFSLFLISFFKFLTDVDECKTYPGSCYLYATGITHADRTCALANLNILEMDAIVQRQVLSIASKTYKRVFGLIQTCMALG